MIHLLAFPTIDRGSGKVDDDDDAIAKRLM
jgi:hypothetical protein